MRLNFTKNDYSLTKKSSLRMMRSCFHMLVIFMLCIAISVNCGYFSSREPKYHEEFYKSVCENALKQCSCHKRDLKKGVGAIECKNITDFQKFSQNFQFLSFYEWQVVSDITFTDVNYIPAGTFRGRNISHLTLNGPHVDVDQNVFLEIEDIRRFHVWRSSIQDIPDFRIVKDTIDGIKIHSSALTSLEGQHLQNLTYVKVLSFANNSIRSIDPYVFQGTDNVYLLDLSHNSLTSIPSGLLDPMTKLLKFDVSYNHLLHVDNLFSVTHPQFIFLDYNNITDAESILYDNMTEVEVLTLAGNPIEKISEKTFNEKIPRVKSLFLEHCKLGEFTVEYYWSLSELESLDLSYNLIEKISKQQIPRDSAALKNDGIERFNLSSNNLHSLNLLRNKIKYLTDKDFETNPNMTRLQLQENEIQWIDSDTFRPVRKYLRHLDLSSNFITSLNKSIRHLSRLQLLNVSHNSIQSLEDEFIDLTMLSELYLQYNQIKVLGQLQQLTRIQSLMIDHNALTSIQSKHLPMSLRLLHLSNNPFRCDCSMEPLIFRLNASNYTASDTKLCLQSDHDNDPHRNSDCPPMCICGCFHNENDSFLFVDCSSRNLSTLPHFLKDRFMQMEDNVTTPLDDNHAQEMYQNVHPTLHIRDRILGVNLENNRLESLEGAKLSSNLYELYLSNNKLSRLPDFVLDNLLNLQRVTLTENPWDCGCNAWKLKKWLTSNPDIIIDINEVRCGISKKEETVLNGRVMWKLTDHEICPLDVPLIVSASSAVLIFVILCLTAKILFARHELIIKVILRKYLGIFRNEEFNANKKFDAFISFSHEDDDFVTKEIISVIERQAPNIRLCIHYRHFRPGEFIYDNIVHAVQNSKRTILILSKDFLDSGWCLMELQAAHLQALEDKRHRIIVIKFGNLPKNIDSSIKVYLDSTTYLTWGETYFWEKLYYILPTPTTVRNPVQLLKFSSHEV